MKNAFAIVLSCCMVTPALAAHWNVDRAKSHLGFSVPWQGQPFTGEFKNWTADIDFDPADLAHAKASVSIDVSSVTSGDAESDAGLKGAQGFDTSHFASAKFTATSFRTTGANAYEASGTLALHGMTKTIVLPFKLQMSGANAHITGTANVTRTDFGVGTGQFASDDPVGRAVKVTVDLTATKAP
jgi:polyisoprenoid-binding protein YceI